MVLNRMPKHLSVIQLFLMPITRLLAVLKGEGYTVLSLMEHNVRKATSDVYGPIVLLNGWDWGEYTPMV